MKKFAAHYVFPISSAPISKGIVKTDDSGIIVELIDRQGELQEEAGLEFHNGIICPEFIKAPQHVDWSLFIYSIPELGKHQSITSSDFKSNKSVLQLIFNLQNESVSFDRLIEIFTIELAKFVTIDEQKGSIEIGKAPGLIVISGVDYRKMVLRSNASAKQLI